jgi:hypothetical protein
MYFSYLFVKYVQFFAAVKTKSKFSNKLTMNQLMHLQYIVNGNRFSGQIIILLNIIRFIRTSYHLVVITVLISRLVTKLVEYATL